MKNFEFCVTTDVLFGKGQEESLPQKLAQYGRRVLLAYGGGSIKRIGLYDRICSLLKDFAVFELGGIEPNPDITSVRQGVEICRKENIDVILVVGGGSSIDCAKAIAAARYYDGDAWDLLNGSGAIEKALPLAVVLTLAATGSEMDCVAVISDKKTNEKRFMGHPCLLPKLAILNPENTFTVPPYQTAAGAADIMSHLLESYFDRESAFVADAVCEGLLRTVIKYAPKALAKPDDYEARGQLMWTSSLALNGLVATGKNFMWSCHHIEHELSAYYDITHGAGLAMLTPKWMRYVLSEATVDKFVEYAVNVWHIERSADKFAVANKGIDATEQFFKELGLPSTLAEFGIGDERFDQMAARAVELGGLADAYVPLTKEDVKKIYQLCM